MARTDTLSHFLTDVADAIREKKGTQETITASDFDTEIENLPSGGESDVKIDDCAQLFYANFRLDEIQTILPLCSGCSAMWGMFQDSDMLTSITFNNFDTSAVTSMDDMFFQCSSLETVDISSFTTESSPSLSNMFAGCASLQFLDMRNFTFDDIEEYEGIFGTDEDTYIPSDCEIIVKSQTEKDWVLNIRSDFTNVKTVEEYEAE